jgi:predicted permease
MWNDLAKTGRQVLRRWPSTLALVLLIGAGVACAASLFSVIDALLLRPLPFRDQDHLMAVGRRSATTSGPTPMTLTQVASLAETGVLDVAAFRRYVSPNDTTGDTLLVAAVSGPFFRLLGVRPQIGRLLESGDAETGAMVISEGIWRRRFGRDPLALGQRLIWREKPFTIVGVLPRSMEFPLGAQAWVMVPPPAQPEAGASWFAVGRLADNRTAEWAAAQLPRHVVTPLREYIKPGGTFGLVMLLIGTCLLLAVTWVQVAALQFARLAERCDEIRIRMALGASHWQIRRYAAAEGVWLGLGSLAVAALATPALTRFLTLQLPASMTKGQMINVDHRVLAFAVLFSTIGVLAFALGPQQVNERRGGLATLRAGKDHRLALRARTWLVIAQVAVAVPLIYLAGLAWLSSVRLSQADLGFDDKGLWAVRLPPPAVLLPGRTAPLLVERRQKCAELQSLPGVVSVSAGGDLPFGGRTIMPLHLGASRADESLQAMTTIVEPNYFETLGIPQHAGRTFAASDGRDAPFAVIVNNTIAARLRERGRDVGASVLVAGRPAQVVGVVGDTRDATHPSAPPEPRVYLCADQWMAPDYLFVRLDPTDPSAEARAGSHIRRLWPDMPLTFQSVSDRVAGASIDFRGRSTLLALLALAAIAMTLVGVYGAVSGVTRDRTREIAIRIVCGADVSRIAARVVAQAVQWVAVGVAVGLPLAWLGARAVRSLLFDTEALDWTTLTAVAATFLVTALVAAVTPAARAAGVQPVVALRDQ